MYRQARRTSNPYLQSQLADAARQRASESALPQAARNNRISDQEYLAAQEALRKAESEKGMWENVGTVGGGLLGAVGGGILGSVLPGAGTMAGAGAGAVIGSQLGSGVAKMATSGSTDDEEAQMDRIRRKAMKDEALMQAMAMLR